MSGTAASSGATGEPILGGHSRLRIHTTIAQIAPFCVLFLIALAIPVGIFAVYSFKPSSTFLGVESGFTYDHYVAVFDSSSARILLVRTIAIGLSVALVATAVAFVLSYALTFNFGQRLSRVLLIVIVMTSVSSLLVRIFAWGTILGTEGLINQALQTTGVTSEPLTFLLFGYFAILITMLYVYLPLATLIVYSSMQNIDRRTLEASRDLGVGRWRTILRVIAPQASAGLTGAYALVTIVVTADYVTPSLVGGLSGQTVGTLVRDTALGSADYPAAAALAIVFGIAVFFALTVILGGWHVTRGFRRRVGYQLDRWIAKLRSKRRVWPTRQKRFEGWGGRKASPSKIFTFLVVSYLMFPLLVALVFSFNEGNTPGIPWRGFTTASYSEIVQELGFQQALWVSVKLTGISTVGGLLIGAPLAAMLARVKNRWSRAMWLMIVTPLLVPGVLWGAAVVTASTATGMSLGLATTAPVHILLVTPIVVTILYVRLADLNPNLLEASRDLGSRPVRGWRTVILPLILPSLAGAGLMAAAYSLDELFVTTFTVGSDSTVPVWLFSRARQGFSSGLNALGIMLTVALLITFAVALLALSRSTPRSARERDLR